MGRSELRERILDAAAHVLREHGPRPRLITTIAERAQVSRPTLYRHFPDRADIYDSLMRVEIERIVDDVVTRARQTESPYEEYIDVICDFVREGRDHPALRAVLVRYPEIMASHLPHVVPIVLGIAEPKLAPIIEAGVVQGRWPTIDVRAAIVWSTRLIVSLIVMPLDTDATDADLRSAVESLLGVASAIARTETSAPLGATSAP